MKYLLLLTLLLWQSPKKTEVSNLVGKWTYVKYEAEIKLDTESLEMLNHAMANFSYEIKEDGTYTLQKRKKTETGTWTSDKDYITLQSSTGLNDKVRYIQKDKDTLKLEIDKEQYAVFKRN